MVADENVFSRYTPPDEREADQDEDVAGHDTAERHGGPFEAVVERRHDENRDEADGCGQHDQLLDWSLLRRRPAAHPTLEQRGILSDETARREGRCTGKDRQVHSRLPVANGARGDEEQKTMTTGRAPTASHARASRVFICPP